MSIKKLYLFNFFSFNLEDFIDDMGPLSTKLGYAFKQGLKLGLFYSGKLLTLYKKKAGITEPDPAHSLFVGFRLCWGRDKKIAQKSHFKFAFHINFSIFHQTRNRTRAGITLHSGDVVAH